MQTMASPPVSSKQSKTRRKGREAASHVVNIFRLKSLPDRSPRQHRRRAPSVRLQDAIDLPIDPADGIASYEQVEFSFGTGDGNGNANGTAADSDELRSQQHLHFASPNLKEDLSLTDPCGHPTYERIDIFTGMCLFSTSIISKSMPEEKKVDARILESAPATSYEIDYITGSTSALADFVGALVLCCQAEEIYRPIHVTLDIPSIHYYAYIERHVEDGRCTPVEAIRWLRAVERRCKQIAAVFENVLRQKLLARGMTAHAPFTFSITPTPTIMSDLVHMTLAAGQIPRFEEVWRRLQDEQHVEKAWTSFLELLPPKEIPKSFSDLAHLLHVYEVVRLPLEQQPASRCTNSQHALSHSDPDIAMNSAPASLKPRLQRPELDRGASTTDLANIAKRRRHLVLAIDLESQRRIYKRAQPIFKSLRAVSSITGPTKKARASTAGSAADLILVEAYMMPTGAFTKDDKGDVRRVDSGCDVSGRTPQETSSLIADAVQDLANNGSLAGEAPMAGSSL